MSSAMQLYNGMKAPTSPEQLGIPYAVATDLVLRRCLLEGKTNVSGLSKALALHASLVDKIVQELREKKEIEVLGMDGRDISLTLTSLGQKHANDRLVQSHYAGPAPVSLQMYSDVVATQRLAVHVDREMLKQAFSDLVIPDEVLDELGPALNANGKFRWLVLRMRFRHLRKFFVKIEFTARFLRIFEIKFSSEPKETQDVDVQTTL